MFNYEEVFNKLESGEFLNINLYFLMSNSIDGYFYKATLDENNGVENRLIGNIGEFFDNPSINFKNQKLYDFKGKSDDETVEYLNIEDIPILQELLDKAIQGSTDLSSMDFTKIQSFLVELKFTEDSILYLFSVVKQNSFFNVKKSFFMSIEDDSLVIAKLPKKLITVPTFFDICVFNGVVLFLSHSSTVLNKIVNLDIFYNQVIDESLNMIKEFNLIENFSDFQQVVGEKKDNMILKKKFARLQSSKKKQFDELKILYKEEIETFKENFNTAKSEVNLELELNSSNQIVIDKNNDQQIISLLNLLIDAYGKTFMLGNITEN